MYIINKVLLRVSCFVIFLEFKQESFVPDKGNIKMWKSADYVIHRIIVCTIRKALLLD